MGRAEVQSGETGIRNIVISICCLGAGVFVKGFPRSSNTESPQQYLSEMATLIHNLVPERVSLVFHSLHYGSESLEQVEVKVLPF